MMNKDKATLTFWLEDTEFEMEIDYNEEANMKPGVFIPIPTKEQWRRWIIGETEYVLQDIEEGQDEIPN